MTEETYGPPIPVNGKRPDWLGDEDDCQPCWGDYWYPHGWSRGDCVADWPSVTWLKLPIDHPYYQSAEYKASVGEGDIPEWALEQAAQCAGFERYATVGYEAAHSTMKSITAHARTLAEHVTPPDPLAADREFLAGLWEARDLPRNAERIRRGEEDEEVRTVMEYLRANKGRL